MHAHAILARKYLIGRDYGRVVPAGTQAAYRYASFAGWHSRAYEKIFIRSWIQ